MNIASKVATACLVVVASSAEAGGWALFGAHAQLKGYVIADVGEVSPVHPPTNAKWNVDLFQMNGRCFSLAGYSSGSMYGGKAAFLVVNDQRLVKVAFVEESLGGIKVELSDATLYECPLATEGLPYSDDPEKRIEQLKKRAQELNRQYEELRKGER